MDEVVEVPPSTFLYGRRTSWASAPRAVAEWVEATLGAPVGDWHDRVGGMSVGIASVVTAANGDSRFVKAVNGTENPFALDLAVRETELAARLPELPHAPRVLDAGTVTTAGGDRWWVMTTPAAGGLPVRHPWQPADLTRVLRDWDDVAVVLRTTPWETTTRPPPFFTAWSALAADHLDPWQSLVTSWLDREARLLELVGGTELDPAVLSHLDLRADNILVDATEDEVWFVDWAHAGLAARWADYALLLADVVGSGSDVSTGGPIDVLRVWRRHPVTSHYDPELLICMIAGLAAALHLLARRPTDLLLPHRSRWSAAMAAQMEPFMRLHTVA